MSARVEERSARGEGNGQASSAAAGTDAASSAEAQRLARLRSLQLLDTSAEPLFDSLARLASHVAGTPIALISLVDAERQWFKANIGLEGVSETPRAVAFCAHTIEGPTLLEVPDASDDERFAGNPLVTGEPGVRFYAGVPLGLGGGERIGTLCVIDRRPRVLTPAQREQLAEIAAAVVHAIGLRERTQMLHHAQAALAASEAKFRTLCDALPVGVYHADAQGGGTYTNASWQATTGMSFEQALGAGWAEAIYPEDRAQVFARWNEATGRGERFAMEFRMQRPDGTVRDVISRSQPLLGADGELLGHVGTAEDITERLAVERVIAQSNASLRMLYEQTPAKLHSIDRNGRILTVSNKWLSRLGYRREEVLGRRSVEFFTPASRKAILEFYLPRLWREGFNERISLQMLHRDGSVRDVLLSAVLERDAQGQPLRALAVIEDITAVLASAAELQREQQARREIEHQAGELARLAAERREMLDVLAHEVRQPLNNASAAIQSASAMLADKGEQEASARLARAQGVLADVQSQVENTLALSTLLVGVAEAPSPPEEEADIDTVLAVALAEWPAAERARLSVARLTAARTAVMDSALVRLALRNLLGNALRHTRPGTPVLLRVSDSESPLALLIDVVDRGEGLPAEVLPRLFERGTRMRHADGRASHGLGLFIAHRALEVQGGELILLHSGGAGTALRLVLPQGRTA